MKKLSYLKKRNLDLSHLENEHNKCWYCGRDLKGVEVHRDHIVPKSLGGGEELDNKALVCQNCNMAKQDNDLISLLQWFAHIRSGAFECYIVKKLNLQLDGKVNDKLQKSYYK